MAGGISRANGVHRGHGPLISRDAAVPLHAQFREYLIDLIERGDLAPGAQVPRERELAECFNVSLAPVRQAILDLAKEGYVYRVRGKGTFVRAAKVEEKIAILGSFTEAMRARGLAARLQVLHQEVVPPSEAIARQLRTRGRVVRIQRRAVVDGQPIALLEAFLPARRFPGLGSAELEDRSLYAHLADSYGTVLARAESLIEVGRCDPETAGLLALPAGSPVLLVDGVTFDGRDDPVEFSHVLYRADRFRFRLDSVRRSERVIHLIDAERGEDTG
jgi:DNA-binding GntR family transcriptional regulator